MISIAMVMILGVLVVFYLQAGHDARSAQQQLYKELNEVADLLGPLLVQSTIKKDYSTLHAILDKQVQARDHVYRIEWQFNNGITLLGASPDLKPDAPAWFSHLINIKGKHITLRSSLTGGQFGELSIWVSPVATENAVWERFMLLTATALFITLLCAVAIAIIMRNNLKIVENLAQALIRFGKGDYISEVKVRGTPELRKSAIAFNKMVKQTKQLFDNLLETQQQLSEQLLFKQQLLDAIPNPVYYLDKDARFLGCNKSWEVFFGLNGEECRGKRVYELYTFNEAFAATEQEMIKGLVGDDNLKIYESSFVNQQGDLRQVLISEGKFIKGQGEVGGIIGTVVDMTELKFEQQRALLALEDKTRAEMESKAKSRFLANMSHEMRTPLTAIVGLAETLFDAEQSEEQKAESTQIIIRASKYLSQLINDLLDMSRVEAGKLEIEIIPVGLIELVTEVKAIAEIQSKNKGIQFEARYGLPLPEMVMTDALRVKQIIINLISNALKFTEQGKVSLYVEYLRDKQLLKFVVQDTGIGISKQQAAGLFEPFTQADASTTRKYGGTGLGLYLSKTLSNLLGGDISLQSEPGKGSCFTVSIPANLAKQTNWIEQVPDELDMASVETIEFNKLLGKVLLAEDNKDNQRFIGYLLERLGLDYELADNGAEAVTLAQQHKFDLILMDMQMPVMDGLQATQTLRENGVAIPIIAISANMTSSDRQQSLMVGCDDFLGKPVDRQAFIETLGRYLQPGQGENELPLVSSLKNTDPQMMGVVERFAKTLPATINELESLYHQGEFETLGRKVHMLKGSGGNLGYLVLTELSLEIEGYINSHHEEQIPEAIDRLRQLGQRIVRGIGA